jgi:folylpolyglutamate synthase/dihydrofolate synthase
MIRLGLNRTLQLIRDIPQTFKAIHVAGTNGKGSVCAFIDSALRSPGLEITTGRFTSPHLIDRWDCIQIGGIPVNEELYNDTDERVRWRNRDENIGATEFEILTAVAFEIFSSNRVQVAIVECGMGGARDATNALKSKDVAVISKVGLDHQEFLGETLAQIAKEKCGIFTPRVPIVFDRTNDPEVLQVIRNEAVRIRSRTPRPDFDYYTRFPPDHAMMEKVLGASFAGHPYQISNATVAYYAAHHMACFYRRTGDDPPDAAAMLDAIAQTHVPGRLDAINLHSVTGIDQSALLDGAHNSQAIETIAPSLQRLRHDGKGICWVLASSKGKDPKELFGSLLSPGDSVAAVEFGPVAGMPWKAPTPSEQISQSAGFLSQYGGIVRDFGPDVKSALTWTAELAASQKQPVVILGSVYLVSDVLRLLDDLTGTGARIHRWSYHNHNEKKEKKKKEKRRR